MRITLAVRAGGACLALSVAGVLPVAGCGGSGTQTGTVITESALDKERWAAENASAKAEEEAARAKVKSKAR